MPSAPPHQPLLYNDGRGLFCPAGGFHIDPWAPVPIALITHAHGDHARAGSARYLCSASCAPILKKRLPEGAVIEPVPFGEPIELRSAAGDARTARISFHPAGHIRGSAQIRVEASPAASAASEVWVVSGDYKRQPDPTCEPFEVVPCDTFITEATFALPVYRWEPTDRVVHQIATWWSTNREHGRVSVLFSYALGKAQRILAELDALAARDSAFVWMRESGAHLHGAVVPLTDAYREAGIAMLPTQPVPTDTPARRTKNEYAGQLIIAPPSAAGSPWMRRFGPAASVDTAFASGWMLVRGIRRRRGYDRGFVISDHIDWPDLLETIRETGAKRVLATHGYSETLAHHLRDQGLDAAPLETQYGETEASEPEPEARASTAEGAN